MTTREDINKAIHEAGSLNREHLLAYLRTIPTNDSEGISLEVKTWLQTLHDDPYYSKIHFPTEDTSHLGVPGNAIDRILTDLESYGRVTLETIIDAPENIVPDQTMGSEE